MNIFEHYDIPYFNYDADQKCFKLDLDIIIMFKFNLDLYFLKKSCSQKDV